MKSYFRLGGVAVFSLVFLGAVAVFGADKPSFLSPSAIDVKTVLPAFPALGTPESQNDFKKLFDLQTTRSQEDCRRAESEVFIKLQSFFGPPYGSLTEDQIAQWTPFFRKIQKDAGYFSYETKQVWQRPRPYFTDGKVKPCIWRELGFAYPSGHTTIARVFARVLGQIDPKNKDLYMARGNQIAEDRIIGGVHHPSDIRAGQKLGDKIADLLMQNPAFQKEIQKLHL